MPHETTPDFTVRDEDVATVKPAQRPPATAVVPALSPNGAATMLRDAIRTGDPAAFAQAGSSLGNATAGRLMEGAGVAAPTVARSAEHDHGCACASCGTAQKLARSVLARNGDGGATATAAADRVKQLDEQLDALNTDEEKVIELFGQLTDDERKRVLNPGFRDRVAKALDVAEMKRAMAAVKAPLETALDWVQAAALTASAISYSDIKDLVTGASAEDRKKLDPGFRDFFVKVCDNETIVEAVKDLGFGFKTQLQWIDAEYTVTRAEGSWAKIKPLLEAVPAGERPALLDDEWLKDFFVKICDNAEMADATIVIGGPYAKKKAWHDAEGTTANDYLDALVRNSVFEKGTKDHTAAAAADEKIEDALGDLVKEAAKDGARRITGKVAVVGDDDWNVAGLHRYGDQWATKRINGFVDLEGRVWIHKDKGNAGTMIHEGCHKWSKDVLIHESQPLNEGVTEYFTRKVCAVQTPPLAPDRSNYQDNWTVTTKLAGFTSEEKLAAAYFDGDVAGLQAAYETARGGADAAKDWEKFLQHCSDKDWAEAGKLVAKAPPPPPAAGGGAGGAAGKGGKKKPWYKRALSWFTDEQEGGEESANESQADETEQETRRSRGGGGRGPECG